MNEPQLTLMRHAKSDWGDRSLADHDRPLNRRGRGDAPRMADWLVSVDAVPETILCSDALRTRQTAELMLRRWDDLKMTPLPHVVEQSDLYLAGFEALTGAVQHHHGGARRLMLLAHNPGISGFAGMLAGDHCELVTAAAITFVPHPDTKGWQSWGDFSLATPLSLRCAMHPKGLADDFEVRPAPSTSSSSESTEKP